MRPPEWPAFPAAERFANLYRVAPSSAIEAVARERARDWADASLGRSQRRTRCRCSTCARKARATSSAIARSAPSRCRSRRLGARCSTEWPRRAWSGSSSICRVTDARWSTATRNCRSSPRAPRSSRSTSNRSSGLPSAPMGMTAHVVYTAWDPDRPASLSPIVIHDIIRERIGFDGWLMSDDIGMEALAGDFGQPRRRRRCGRLRRRAALLGQDGRNDRRCCGRAGDERSKGHERLARAMAGIR